MRRTPLFGLCLAVTLLTTGCQEQPTEPAPSPATAGPDLALQYGTGDFALERGALHLPAGARISDQYFLELANRAINPDDYVCTTTSISGWINTEVNAWIANEFAIFDLLYLQLWADLIPQYEALYLLSEETPQEFGYDGEYTQVMEKTHKDAERFWDIPSDHIQLLAMKGSMLLDVDRVAATYQLPFVPPFGGLSEADAYFVAELIRETILSSELLDGGNFPLFSFNAFAISFGGGGPDKIVMGDGILAAYEALGFGDVAPQAIHMHEFAHHIQFANDYFDDSHATEGDPPEQTRYTELMADAMSAYYLTHKRGATMNQKRVEQFLQVFFQIGDCSFTSSGHHGTPNQRMKAAQFGFAVADDHQKKGHILSSEEFHDLFVAAYPDIIAPDA